MIWMKALYCGHTFKYLLLLPCTKHGDNLICSRPFIYKDIYKNYVMHTRRLVICEESFFSPIISISKRKKFKFGKRLYAIDSCFIHTGCYCWGYGSKHLPRVVRYKKFSSLWTVLQNEDRWSFSLFLSFTSFGVWGQERRHLFFIRFLCVIWH